MLSDELRARVNAHADREWPHVEGGDPATNSARAARRLTFRQGVEWAMAHTTDEDLPEPLGEEALTAWMEDWYDRFSGPGEPWTLEEMAIGLTGAFTIHPRADHEIGVQAEGGFR